MREPSAATNTIPSITARAARAALRRAAVEALEPRQLLSVSTDGAGFTVVTPSSSARVVYVSTAGSDGNSGSQSSPVKSLSKAKSLIRDGAGDQILLHRGDVWHENFGFWDKSGKSASDPVVIGAYGTGARPRLETGSSTGLAANDSIHDIAILGVEFSAAGRGGSMPDGIKVNGSTSNLRIEDTKISGYRNNITLQSFFGQIKNITVRRSIIVDSWSKGSHSQGIYAEKVAGITLDENIFDHNGWGNGAGQTPFNHAAYITGTSSGLVARNNVFANSSSHGLQARPGGTVTGNLFYNNAIGLSFGLVNGGGENKPGGVTGTIDGNVFFGGHNVGGVPAGVGVEMSNIKSATLSNNLFLNGPPSDNPAISLAVNKSQANGGAALGVNNLTITGNVIYNWSRGIVVAGGLKAGGSGPSGLNNLVVNNNDFQNIRSFQAVQIQSGYGSQSWSSNRFYVPGNAKTPIMVGGSALTVAGFKKYDSGAQNVQVGYPEAGRSVNSYAGDFLARARNLSKTSWDSRYTASGVVAYLRGGFKGGSLNSKPIINVPSTSGGKAQPAISSSSPSISIGDISASEGDGGLKKFTFTISLSHTSSKSVAVKWETKGDTARVGADYVGRNGSATFNPGDTKKTVSIDVKADNVKEATETFVLNLLSATGGSIGDNQGRATIVNDD